MINAIIYEKLCVNIPDGPVSSTQSRYKTYTIMLEYLKKHYREEYKSLLNISQQKSQENADYFILDKISNIIDIDILFWISCTNPEIYGVNDMIEFIFDTMEKNGEECIQKLDRRRSKYHDKLSTDRSVIRYRNLLVDLVKKNIDIDLLDIDIFKILETPDGKINIVALEDIKSVLNISTDTKEFNELINEKFKNYIHALNINKELAKRFTGEDLEFMVSFFNARIYNQFGEKEFANMYYEAGIIMDLYHDYLMGSSNKNKSSALKQLMVAYDMIKEDNIEDTKAELIYKHIADNSKIVICYDQYDEYINMVIKYDLDITSSIDYLKHYIRVPNNIVHLVDSYPNFPALSQILINRAKEDPDDAERILSVLIDASYNKDHVSQLIRFIKDFENADNTVVEEYYRYITSTRKQWIEYLGRANSKSKSWDAILSPVGEFYSDEDIDLAIMALEDVYAQAWTSLNSLLNKFYERYFYDMETTIYIEKIVEVYKDEKDVEAAKKRAKEKAKRDKEKAEALKLLLPEARNVVGEFVEGDYKTKKEYLRTYDLEEKDFNTLIIALKEEPSDSKLYEAYKDKIDKILKIRYQIILSNARKALRAIEDAFDKREVLNLLDYHLITRGITVFQLDKFICSQISQFDNHDREILTRYIKRVKLQTKTFNYLEEKSNFWKIGDHVMDEYEKDKIFGYMKRMGFPYYYSLYKEIGRRYVKDLIQIY